MDSIFLSILKAVDEFAISSNSIELKNRLIISQVPQRKKYKMIVFF